MPITGVTVARANEPRCSNCICTGLCILRNIVAMKNQIMIGLLLSMALSHSAVHANAVQSSKSLNYLDNKPSLIEKAIWQKKQQRNDQSGIDLVMLNELQMTSPTQSFFAAQNQRFSRLMQALFNSTKS